MPSTAAASCRPSAWWTTCRWSAAKEQGSLAGDVDALVSALDARAALEIGITQVLGDWLATEAERDALVARLRAFTPLVRGTTPAHVARYIRAADAFHRVFFSLLRNPVLFEIYNAMDLPELMRRVLEVAPVSIREVFDDHKGLTDALRSGDVDATCAAMTAKANRVRAALATFLVDRGAGRRGAWTGRQRAVERLEMAAPRTDLGQKPSCLTWSADALHTTHIAATLNALHSERTRTMSEYVKLATGAGDQFLTALAESQELPEVRDRLHVVGARRDAGSGVAPFAAPFAAELPTPKEVAEANFAFASKLLKQQKDFTEKFLAATAPAK